MASTTRAVVLGGLPVLFYWQLNFHRNPWNLPAKCDQNEVS
jgi:hypothetical protein